MTLSTTHGTKTVQDFVDLFKAKRLNLSPAFQRQSVWSESDRRLLINSIFANIPLPSVYLYRQVGSGGRPLFDVIDGKQRLESILLFMRRGPLVTGRTDNLWIRRALNENDLLAKWTWKDLDAVSKNHFLTTQLPAIEVEGDLGEIIELFVRINATGKKLTPQERRHAHFYATPVLKEAQRTADSLAPLLRKGAVISPGQFQRMKHVELVTELLLAINLGMPLNKKTKIDEIIQGKGGPDAKTVSAASTSLHSAVNVLFTILPDLKTTRFRQLADFYTLVLLLYRYRQEGRSVTAHNSTRNLLAGSLLRDFGLGVDEVNEKIARAKPVTTLEQPFREYVMTVKEGTDSKPNRDRRETLLRGVLDGVFEPLDSTRNFSITQRRILWHASGDRRCAICRKPVKRWEDVSIDHVTAYIKGGVTDLSNAALTHRTCNSGKGAA
jgi:5-methylcytosine-specific restriction endonuclease McrA